MWTPIALETIEEKLLGRLEADGATVMKLRGCFVLRLPCGSHCLMNSHNGEEALSKKKYD